jgi:hypothetical protein
VFYKPKCKKMVDISQTDEMKGSVRPFHEPIGGNLSTLGSAILLRSTSLCKDASSVLE